MIIKKTTILFFCIFFTIAPIICNISPSYAEEEQSNNSWTYINDQLSEANRDYTIACIKAYFYLRGFNLNFTYNTQKAIVNFTYNHWNRIAKDYGISGGLAELNSKFAYAVDKNGFLKFYYKATALSTLNTLYQAILEYYNIGENQSKNIYDGEYFVDNDGHGCYIFISNGSSSIQDLTYSSFNSSINQWGTCYNNLYGDNFSDFSSTSIESYVINYKNNGVNTSKNYYIYKHIGSDNKSVNLNSNNTNPLYGRTAGTIYFNYNSGYNYEYNYKQISGYVTLWKRSGTYYLSAFRNYFPNNSDSSSNIDQFTSLYSLYNVVQLTNPSNGIPASISAAQAGLNAGIVAQGKAAAVSTGKDGINALKDYLEDNDPDDTTAEPVDDNEEPPVNNITNFFIGGILNANGQLDFQMPDLSNLKPDSINSLPNNFLIPGLRYKFPFCIPFDLIAIFDFLNEEPEAPRIQQQIDFGIFNYNLDVDLSVYDSAMINIRKFIVVLYIFGLLFVTPKLIK